MVARAYVPAETAFTKLDRAYFALVERRAHDRSQSSAWSESVTAQAELEYRRPSLDPATVWNRYNLDAFVMQRLLWYLKRVRTGVRSARGDEVDLAAIIGPVGR